MSQLIELVEKQRPAIQAALPKHLDAGRMVRVAITALRLNPALARTKPETFLGALMVASQLGLEINTPLGQAYVIPYKDVATFVIGYKGLLDLAYRTGNYEIIDAETVYQNDHFEYELGFEAKLRHKPAPGDRGAAIGYYALYKLKNGGKAFKYWSKEDVIRHAEKFSQAFKSKSSPWASAFDQMAKKTVLKDLLKYAPMSPEDRGHIDAIDADGAVVRLAEDNSVRVEHADPIQIEAENKQEEQELVEQQAALQELN